MTLLPLMMISVPSCRCWVLGVDGGRVHDGASRLHMRDCGLAEIEHAVDVCPESNIPFLGGYILDRLKALLMGRIVNEDIDLPER